MRRKPDFWKGNDRICWLCTLMEHFVGTTSLEHAPVLMSGMASVLAAPKLARARQALFNLRQLSLSFVTTQSIKHAIALYNEHHFQQSTTGAYRIDPETLTFELSDFLEDPLIAEARAWLSRPVDYESHTMGFADPVSTMSVQIGEAYGEVRVPIGPITTALAPRRTHNLARVPKGSVHIPLAELREIAQQMDEHDVAAPERRRGNWGQRLESFSVLTPVCGRGLEPADTIELQDVKHLIGLPGSGKTTILMLVAMWLGRAGLKAMLIFPSIEVARQYMSDLAFHGVKVGMLVGQNPTTRREHADRIADAIAAAGGQGGFAHTIDGADSFAANCVLPAFATDDASLWAFGYAPCEEILQGNDRTGRLRKRLCPLWTRCGRNKAPRDLLDADIWVGHVLSMDTRVPAHAIDARIRYFELIARTFDVVIFDEADMVQSHLDAHGAAVMSISGSSESIHRQIQEQIHDRFARGENHRLFDRNIELYSRDLAEFGNHNYTLVSIVQNIDEHIKKRFADQLLTTSRIIAELRDGLTRRHTRRDDLDDADVKHGFTVARALTDFWDTAAYTAFYDRTGVETHHWPKGDLCARTLEIAQSDLDDLRLKLIQQFRRYLAENLNLRRDEITGEIAKLFGCVCFADGATPHGAEDAIRLLVSITFMILGYQRIVPGTRQMVAEGLIRDPPIKATATPELRRFIPENIVGSLSGVKYSLSPARTTRTGPQNVELSYISFGGAPRMLMHRFGRILEADGIEHAPAVLMTSATSFLAASPAYHITAGPHYLLRPRTARAGRDAGNALQPGERDRTRYVFKWIPDRNRGDIPLRYSGAGDLAARNLECMVSELVRGGREKSELYKAIDNFDVRDGIRRKAALVVNSYEQARRLKRYLDDHHREIGRRTKTVVRSLEAGENPTEYVTPAQAEALGDDEHCDVIIFPLTAIGRGINIVFTKGPRARDAAIGSIYFLTRPHPSGDDMQLLQSLAGRATQEFDQHIFTPHDDVTDIAKRFAQAKRGTFRLAKRLLQEPLQASRLGTELFKPFTANQMVAILQTIGRGMRNGCPVAVHFVDAAWAPRSTMDNIDDARTSMLVQMRLILEECVSDPDPAVRAIYEELYLAFLKPLREVARVNYPEELRTVDDKLYANDGFDDANGMLEI
jgi:hypothetical protein